MNISKRIILVVLCLCVVLGVAAQQSGKRKRRTSVSEVPADPRLTQMIHNTQRIMFIDSMVVPRQEVFKQLRLTTQAGRVWQESNDTYYENELGFRRFYAKENGKLYTQHRLGSEWCDEQELSGIIEPGAIDSISCPFLMNDGLTLYFAARGTESIGGYDLFVTRYSTDNKSFLKPENIGMPFNSTADDLFYIIDEGANIGYFATTRKQPEGYACIYCFVPPTTRQTYAEGYSEAQLKHLAAITNIAETWSSEQERTIAVERMLSATQPSASSPSSDNAQQAFVINDNIVYTKSGDFRAPGNADRYKQLTQMRRDYERQSQELQKTRNYYVKATPGEREQLKSDIFAAEQQLEQLERDIQQMEKLIRNTEVQHLNF